MSKEDNIMPTLFELLNERLDKKMTPEMTQVIARHRVLVVNDIGGCRYNALATVKGEVYVTDALTRHLSPTQMEAVIQHEKGHIAHKDGIVRIALSWGLLLGTIYATYRAPKGLKTRVYVCCNVITMLLTTLHSWIGEFRADSNVYNKLALCSALMEINRLNNISDSRMTQTHPSLNMRMQMLKKFC